MYSGDPAGERGPSAAISRGPTHFRLLFTMYFYGNSFS